MRIELPNRQWFLCRHEGRFVTNTYSGSVGTRGDAGCISTLTLQYRVYVDISSGNENEFRMIAESYLIQPWHLGGCKTDPERAEFPCSGDCVAHAGAWLEEVCRRHGFQE